ncbi:MAG: ribosome silencing factor [Chloroflexi bacterium]|nr:ribosome silencing factor [Chloroflexota bacterium]
MRTRTKSPKSVDKARAAVEAASEKQASDIILLDLREACDFTDYFVICTAESAPQIEAIAEDVEKALHDAGATLHHREGASDSGWVLLDFSDIVVHIFSPAEREYYQLDRVWSAGKPLVRIQ